MIEISWKDMIGEVAIEVYPYRTPDPIPTVGGREGEEKGL
jgi:hypothetical protein